MENGYPGEIVGDGKGHGALLQKSWIVELPHNQKEQYQEKYLNWNKNDWGKPHKQVLETKDNADA